MYKIENLLYNIFVFYGTGATIGSPAIPRRTFSAAIFAIPSRANLVAEAKCGVTTKELMKIKKIKITKKFYKVNLPQLGSCKIGLSTLIGSG